MTWRTTLYFVPMLMTTALLSSFNEPTAQTACRNYKVNVPILQVRKDPKVPGVYVTALTNGETACVSDAPLVGGCPHTR